MSWPRYVGFVPGGGVESPGAGRLVNGRFAENSKETPTGSCWPVSDAHPANLNVRRRGILLKNSKMQSSHFLAKLNRDRPFTLRIVGVLIRRLLVRRIAKARLPQRLKCSEASVGLQFF